MNTVLTINAYHDLDSSVEGKEIAINVCHRHNEFRIVLLDQQTFIAKYTMEELNSIEDGKTKIIHAINQPVQHATVIEETHIDFQSQQIKWYYGNQKACLSFSNENWEQLFDYAFHGVEGVVLK